MASIAVAFPVLPGMEERARRFAEEVSGPRSREMGDSLRRMGATREDWYMQPAPQGSLIIVSLEGEDPHGCFARWSQSRDPFDCWFKQEAGAICGLDFDQPLPPLPERVFAWSRE